MKVLALVVRFARLEIALYRCLLRWVLRRPVAPAGSTPYGYVGAVSLLLWAFITGSAVELVVLHVVIPWETVRLVVDVLSLWGLVWMLGYAASLYIHPHVVGPPGLRVRQGHDIDLLVPWDAVAGVTARERHRDRSAALQVDRDDRGAVLSVVMDSRTNVEVTLSRPLTFLVEGADGAVTEVRLIADDPRALVAQLREQAADRAPRS